MCAEPGMAPTACSSFPAHVQDPRAVGSHRAVRRTTDDVSALVRRGEMEATGDVVAVDVGLDHGRDLPVMHDVTAIAELGGGDDINVHGHAPLHRCTDVRTLPYLQHVRLTRRRGESSRRHPEGAPDRLLDRDIGKLWATHSAPSMSSHRV